MNKRIKEISMGRNLKASRQFKNPTITGINIKPKADTKTASDINMNDTSENKSSFVDDMNRENNGIHSNENTQEDVDNELVPIEKKKNILGKILEKITEISSSISNKARNLFSKKTTVEGEENGTVIQEETSVSNDWLPKEQVDTREAVKKTLESASQNKSNRRSQEENIEFE